MDVSWHVVLCNKLLYEKYIKSYATYIKYLHHKMDLLEIFTSF